MKNEIEGVVTKTVYGTQVRIIAVNIHADGTKSGSVTVLTESGAEIPVRAESLIKPEKMCPEFEDLKFFVEQEVAKV